MAKKIKSPAPIEMLENSDCHWYREVGTSVWLPSVSTILGILKDGLEYVSPYELKKAQERGTKVHKGTELLEEGWQLEKRNYTAQEYDMLGGFINWRKMYNLETLASEKMYTSTKLGYAGTVDRIYSENDTTTLVDLKTTSAIYPKAWLQVAAYAQLAEKCGSEKIMHVGILRLTDRSKAKFQWEYKDRTEWQADLKIFNEIFDVWKYLNKDSQPKESDLPDVISL
jgi:hypothetical protein